VGKGGGVASCMLMVFKAKQITEKGSSRLGRQCVPVVLALALKRGGDGGRKELCFLLGLTEGGAS
jgi:hypothetical protein